MARTKKRMLWRDILATFKKSRGRFLSIACLIALGSFALVGLKVAGPDMRKTSASYFASYDMADLAVIGGMGIDADDAADIEQASGIREVEYGYLKDVTIAGTNDAVRVESAPDHVSQFEVVDGRMPAAEDEIAVDSFMAERYPVGSTIEFSEKEDASGSKTLKRETFTVVGHVSSMDIIANVNKGKTTVGTGDLSGYAVVSPDVFDVDYHMIARLTFDDTEGLDPYGAEYLSKVASHKEELGGLLSDAPERRLSVVRGEYDEQIDDGQKKVDDARQQLADAKVTLDDAAAQLADGRAKLADSWSQLESAASKLARARQQLADAKCQLASAQTLLVSTRSQLDSGWGEYNDGVAQLADARKQMEAQVSEAQGQLDASRSQLNDGKAAYEQGIAQLQAMLDNPNLPADMRTRLQTQLSQTQDAYDRFMDVDAGSVEGEQDGGYTALVAKLDAAQQQLDEQKAAGESQLAQKQAELDAAKEKLQAGETEYASGLAQYQDKKASYDAGVAEYEDGRSSYESGLAAYNSAAGTLAQKQSEYEDGLAEYNDALPDAEQQIVDGEADLADARAERDKLERPTYNVDTRRETPGAEGYKTYDSVSEIVDSLADIFPYFLYLVAALVASTTMTRMVDEERINSGTLKALGYRDRDVMKKFVAYGAAAGGLGSLVGIVLGAVEAIFYQGIDPSVLIDSMVAGAESDTGAQLIDTLLSAGGINEMLETISIILLVMAYAGIMQHCGLMASMVEPIINRLKSLASLVGATVFSGALFNVLLPDQYPAITMSTLVYRDEFNRRGVDRAAWGNIVNSSAGITSVLVPWNTCSIYMVTILGVACVDYMGYAFFCYLYPIVVFIVAALFGKKLGWAPKDDPEPASIEAKAEA